MSLPIIDLHCDLLGCIEHNEGKYDFDSPELNCSIPQLTQGHVLLQVMAVAAITKKASAQVGKRQVEIYKELLATKPDQVASFSQFSLSSPKVHGLFAIENASAIIEEEEPLHLAFERLDQYAKTERILYLSLTWNQENRFGGGNLTTIGLKEDGKMLLDYLSAKQIAIDFSHTSDALAYDILNYIERKSLKISFMASHSNYRAIHPSERNLPEEIAKEIIAKEGIIGLNFVHRFVGDSPEAFLDHIDYALTLKGENAISIGADFYGGLDDLAKHLCPGRTPTTFFSDYNNSSTYPAWIELLKTRFSDKLIAKICYQNALHFIKPA